MGLVDDQILFGILREILDFIELIDADITSQALSVLYNLTGKVRADARNRLQGRGVSGGQFDCLAWAELGGLLRNQRDRAMILTSRITRSFLITSLLMLQQRRSRQVIV